jgi:NAD+-dependent protein deacetylase sirtuin 4
VSAAHPEAVESLALLLRGRAVIALTGAGMSTRSGIPDYRGPTAPVPRRDPMRLQELLGSEGARRRYWARAVVGWPRFRAARPNAAHDAVARLEACGHLLGTITQNVDRLHHAAGSRHVVELHGALHRVRCLRCDALEDRDALQARLLALNPSLRDHRAPVAPDGDADLPDALVDGFAVPGCVACGGILKPDVVFFGESVPRSHVVAASELVQRAEAMLVAGSSLMVLSGLRFVREAARRELPIAIVNLGPTRGDPHAAIHVHADVTDALPRLCDALGGSPG